MSVSLGITANYCTPCSPHEKPHIERVFETFQHGFVPRLNGFIGHSVADRKAIESRRSFADRVSKKAQKGLAPNEKAAMELCHTPEEFQQICNEWAQNVYGEKIHSSLGVSPNDAAARAINKVFLIDDERALDMLLMPLAGNQGIRRVSKKGLRVDNGIYNASLLGGLEGEDVQVRHDENNAGYVYVFTLDGLFICRAEDPALSGVSRRELALARKAHQNTVLGRKVKEAKAIVAKVKPQESAAMILNMKARQASVKQAERNELFGAINTTPYTTPALEQAAFAAACEMPLQASPMTPEEALSRKLMEDSWILENIPKVQNINQNDLASKEAFVTAKLLLHYQEQGSKLSPAEVKWLLGYQSTVYSGIHQEMLNDFGDAAFADIKAFAIS